MMLACQTWPALVTPCAETVDLAAHAGRAAQPSGFAERSSAWMGSYLGKMVRCVAVCACGYSVEGSND